MDRLDDAVIDFLRSTLLAPKRIETLMTPLMTHREDWADRRRQHVVELRAQVDEAERKLRNLYEAVENDMLASTDRMFKERIAQLSTRREQAETEADRVEAMVIRTGPMLSMQDVIRMAKDARMRFQTAGKPPRQIIRTLLQRVEVVGKDEARVEGSRDGLLKAIASTTGNRAIMTAGAGGLSWHLAAREGMEDAYVFCVAM
ncbi:MAG: hypothetical protein J0G28_15675 [Afipia sp.]|nr:hypothetical protein [Afipia sp.]